MLYFQRMFENLKMNAQLHALKTYEIYWDVFLKSMKLYEGAGIFLQLTKDVPICLVTDLTAHIQHRKLLELNIEKYINFMVSSEEAGIEKPHSHIFEMALSKLKLQPNDVIMIGDNFQKDIVGASLLGIRSFWINPDEHHPTKVASDFESVSNFFKLKERLIYEFE